MPVSPATAVCFVEYKTRKALRCFRRFIAHLKIKIIILENKRRTN